MESLHKKISKRNLADVGINQLIHWLTKRTNKECHETLYSMKHLGNYSKYSASPGGPL